MRRLGLIAAVALRLAAWPAGAYAQGVDYWFNYQNTAGLAQVISPGAGACFLYSSAAFDVDCYTSIPSTFVTGLFYQQWTDNTFTPLPQEVYSTAGGGLSVVDDPGDTATIVSLATYGTASTCAWANVSTDLFGRTTCTPNTAPQPAGNYITALTHDVVATGPGSVSAEVVGVTDGTSVDHPVAAGAWTNGQALALDGSGKIHTAAFQAPLTACTDYVHIACQSGTHDLSGTDGTVTVVGVQNTASMRGDMLATAIVAPGTPAAGIGALYYEAASKNICAKDDAGNVNHGIRDKTCGASTWISTVANTGISTCTQPAFSDLSGSASCAQIPTTTCGATTTYGSSGSYLANVTVDSTLRVPSVTVTSTPLASALVYTLASSSLSMGQNQSTLVMPMPAGAPIINTAAAGVPLATTLSANWGSSSQSPPTFFAPIGSIKCTGDITFYSSSGGGQPVLVSAVWYVTGNAFLPGSWHSLASQSQTLNVGSGSGRATITLSASSTSGLVPSDASLVFVFYRSDAVAGTTLNTLNTQVVCSLGT